MTLRHRLLASVPPLARRDAELVRRAERIERLRTSVDRLKDTEQRLRSQVDRLQRKNERLDREADRLRAEVERRIEVAEYLSRPSYERSLITLQRTSGDLRSIDRDLRHPLRQLPFKLRNYRLGASHGVLVPTVLQVWSSVEDISFDHLPDSFVLKSDGGAGGHGVLPLRRTGGGRFETVDGVRSLTEDDVREHFAVRVAGRRISGPFFAEELLVQPDGGPIPDDIKLYTMYGEVAQFYIRRVGRHGDLKSVTRRYLTDEGEDLGQALTDLPSSAELPAPDHFDQIVDIGRHLSRAVGLPFARVDMYATQAGPVLGEITRAPGGRQRFRAERDEALGRAWEAAAYRLDLEVLAGRPPGLLHGDHPAPNLYPAGHVSRSDEPGAWEPTVVSCDEWCSPRLP
jgi:FtsZ-binding cell division protein ZapB